MKNENPLFNGSGYKDLTPYKVIKSEAAREQSEKHRLTMAIAIMKEVAELAGFEVSGRIFLRDKKSGKEYR